MLSGLAAGTEGMPHEEENINQNDPLPNDLGPAAGFYLKFW